MKENRLNVELFGRGFAWLDTGTHKSLLRASNYVETIEENQGIKIACLEEVAYNNGWITKDALLEIAKGFKTDYGAYLKYIAENF